MTSHFIIVIRHRHSSSSLFIYNEKATCKLQYYTFEPTLFGALIGGDSAGIFANRFGVRKLVPGISYGFIFVILGLAICVELRLVTDRQSDRPTDIR